MLCVCVPSNRQFVVDALVGGLDLPDGFHSCSEIPPGHPSGVYTIVPACGADPQQLYCDLDTDGGGWNLVGSSWQHPLEFNSLPIYYDDLQTIAPESGHSGVWDGLLQSHPSGGDLRVSCSSNLNSGNTEFDIDAIARDVEWYPQIVARTPSYGSVAASRLNGAEDCLPSDDQEECGVYSGTYSDGPSAVNCLRDAWPDDSSRPAVCRSLDGMMDEVHTEGSTSMLWGMDTAVALDRFHISFQACASLMHSPAGGQMLLWYRNRPTAVTPVVSLSAGESEVTLTAAPGGGSSWQLDEVISGEVPASAIASREDQSGIRLELFSLPLLPSGSDWTIAWSITAPNGLGAESNHDVPASLRALVSDLPPGWYRAALTWGENQVLRFSANDQSWEYHGSEPANAIAKRIFEAQRDAAEDPLFTDMQVYAAVLSLSDTGQSSGIVIGHEVVPLEGTEVALDETRWTALDRSLALDQSGWVTAWTVCAQATEMSQSTLVAQIWRPVDSSVRVDCVEVSAGRVALVAGTFVPQGTNTTMDIPAGAAAPVDGTFCPALQTPSGCQPRDGPPGCDSFEEADCTMSHCEWTSGSCQNVGATPSEPAACQTFESYAECPRERCQFVEEYSLVCSSELEIPAANPAAAGAANEADMCSADGRWHHLEVPYSKQCEARPGDIVGWSAPVGFIRAGQRPQDQQGPELSMSTESAATDGSRQIFASVTPEANLAHSVSATIRPISPPSRPVPAGARAEWNGAAGVYVYSSPDCTGVGSPSVALAHVERIDEVSVCETHLVPRAPPTYVKKTCTVVDGLVVHNTCNDSSCTTCTEVAVDMEIVAEGCSLLSGCSSFSIPGFSNVTEAVYPQCFDRTINVDIILRASQQCMESSESPSPPTPPPPPQIVGLRDCTLYSQSYCDMRCQECYTYGTTGECEATGRCSWRHEFEETGAMTAELTLADDASDSIGIGWEIVASMLDAYGGPASTVRGTIDSYDASTKVIAVSWEDPASPPSTADGTEYTLHLSSICQDGIDSSADTSAPAVEDPDCEQKCVGFKHCVTCMTEDPTLSCPAALPNQCVETNCSNVLDEDGIAYVLCDGVCAPQEVCHASGDRNTGDSCTAASQCISGSCAEHPDECPLGCISLPSSYCSDNSLDAAQCARMAQVSEVCPAEFAACENAGPRCRPAPCEPVSCTTELAQFILDGFSYENVIFWREQIESVDRCWFASIPCAGFFSPEACPAERCEWAHGSCALP